LEARAVDVETGEPLIFAVFTATTDTVSEPAAVATVEVSPSSATIEIGQTLQLAATIRDSAGAELSGREIQWSSSDVAVASVSPAGIVTGASQGSATITAVSEGQSSAANVVVTDPAPPPAGGTQVSWDWSTATGNTSSAILDAGKTPPWSAWRTAGGLPLLNVTSASGLGFPSANVLRTTLGGTNSSDVRALDLWPVPAPGQSLYFRMYVRFDIPDRYGNLGSSNHHPIQPEPGVCPSNWAFYVGSFADGTLDIGWAFNTSSAGFFLSRVLRKYQTYRWEWAFHRQPNGAYKADIRIFNAAGQLVADGRNFISRWNPDYTSPLSSKNPDLNISDSCIRRLMVGYNGPSWPSMSDAFTYYGAVSVKVSNNSNDWIGPY
jgi:hypothetical protein